MRLVEVEIENYKQYAGTHVFRPGEKAMVAVVGQNGAGKTTLFEAIEWCLYNPSRIKNDSLIPRVQGGKPRVRVVLEDQHSGAVYEVERLLKSGSTQAEVYRQDQPESPLVQGTKQVTEFVARELTGLSHTAFVATFFTRQKELSFFGDLGATQRREQVGRLLGLETIRVAQKRIGEQRTRKQAEARVKREQFEEQSSGTDFPVERARLDADISAQTGQRDAARADEATCKDATVTASSAREVAQERFAAYAALQQQAGQTSAEQRRLTELRESAERDLAAIANAEQEIVRQQGHAAKEPELHATLERHDAEKRKQDEVTRLSDDLRRVQIERAEIGTMLVTDRRIAGAGDGSVRAALGLVSAFEVEIDKLAAIDLDSLRRRSEAARNLAELGAKHESTRGRLESMERLAGELTSEIAALTSDGTPADRLARLHQERTALQQAATASSSIASQTEQRIRPLQQLEQSLRSSQIGEMCPTCARPFQPGEAAKTLDALAEQIRHMQQGVASEHATVAQLNARVNELAASESTLMKANDALAHLTGRLENGRAMIAEKEQEVTAIAQELALRLAESDWQEAPTADEIDRLTAELKRAETECNRRPRLELGREQLIASITRQESLETQLAVLGVVAYDPVAHRNDHAAWAVARDALARIDELQKQVARRPERESVIGQANDELDSLVSARTRIESDIAVLAFDPIEVESANRAFAVALDRERAATATAHAAEDRLTQVQRARRDLDEFEARLETLSKESAAAEIAAGELDRIYREFARFEKFVAVAVTPVLGEIASELLEKATDGKYDRLEFTEDYGIEVYDGEEDRFPLSQYSGGERDVIALCARLALSQVIGGQAATPIKFMVLDEVFGSLDPDRRRNLMEMLQRLMEENQAFDQLFVISHVDDVRAASMFDEVWRVSESSEGVSELEQVSVTGSIEDY